MDPLEAMVNQRTAERRRHYERKRMAKNLKPVCIAVAVALACLLFALLGLAHPGLAVPIMVTSLMVGCYYLGRCVWIGRRWC